LALVRGALEDDNHLAWVKPIGEPSMIAVPEQLAFKPYKNKRAEVTAAG
jgi:hypothetical protein